MTCWVIFLTPFESLGRGEAVKDMMGDGERRRRAEGGSRAVMARWKGARWGRVNRCQHSRIPTLFKLSHVHKMDSPVQHVLHGTRSLQNAWSHVPGHKSTDKSAHSASYMALLTAFPVALLPGKQIANPTRRH